MEVYLNSITGLDDAMTALLMSKRHWDSGRQMHNTFLVQRYTNGRGKRVSIKDPEHCMSSITQFDEGLEKVLRIGKKHITLLKFIDISVTVDGLHRAGQDDWDSHAKRFDNRIIRESTRLADFDESEMSDYYKGKILTTEQVFRMLGLEIPQKANFDGVEYVRSPGGYVREDMAGNRDVKRGLYRECIPSRFIFKCNLAEFAHVYKMRRDGSGANPEVVELCETIADLLEEYQPQITRQFLLEVEN